METTEVLHSLTNCLSLQRAQSVFTISGFRPNSWAVSLVMFNVCESRLSQGHPDTVSINSCRCKANRLLFVLRAAWYVCSSHQGHVCPRFVVACSVLQILALQVVLIGQRCPLRRRTIFLTRVSSAKSSIRPTLVGEKCLILWNKQRRDWFFYI